MLSKKHYQRIASVIEKHQAGKVFSVRVAVWQIAEELSDCFAEDNDRFDYYRFINACGFRHPPA